jgi:hypothetical protein
MSHCDVSRADGRGWPSAGDGIRVMVTAQVRHRFQQRLPPDDDRHELLRLGSVLDCSLLEHAQPEEYPVGEY